MEALAILALCALFWGVGYSDGRRDGKFAAIDEIRKRG